MSRCSSLTLFTNIYVAGNIRLPDGSSASLARLLPSGQLDLSFTPVITGTSEIQALLPLPDGRLLVGGVFRFIAGAGRNGVARLDADGTLDPSFDPGDEVFANLSSANVLAPAAEGKVYVSGRSAQSPSPSASILRLLPNGSRDPSFVAPSAILFNVMKMLPLPDGKILIAGLLPYQDFRPLARLNPDGTTDLSFGTRFSLGGRLAGLDDVSLLPDGRILIAGAFDAINDVPVPGFGLLSAKGEIDRTFSGQLDFNTVFYSLLPHSDGSLYISGDFTKVGSAERLGLARLFLRSRPRLLSSEVLLRRLFRAVVNAELGGRYTVESSTDLNSWSFVNEIVPTGAQIEFIQPIVAPRRFYRLKSD